MNSLSKLNLILVIGIFSMINACGPKFKSSSNPPPPPDRMDPVVNPDGTIPGTPGQADPLNPASGIWSSGGSAVFKPVSNDVFNKWVGNHPVDVENAMINVHLNKAVNKQTYFGTVKLRYQHAGKTYEATLNSGSDSYKGHDFYKYNYIFQYNGKSVFSGFFEDKVGSIVLIVDKYFDLGDGAGVSEVGGEVWFKNFQSSWAAYDEGAYFSIVLPCWFRSIGPYDCRSDSVMNKTGLYPTNNYEKLGEFSNMNLLKATED